MSQNDVAFKRVVGSTKAITKDQDGYLTIQISLDGNPNWTWIECFKHPSTYKPNEAHPSRAQVNGDIIVFTSSESGVKPNIEMMDSYIQQANDCYNRKMADQLAEENRLLERERKRQEEIGKINETLKDL